MPGAVYWIDHYTIPTNDIARAIAFNEAVLGAVTIPDSGLPSERGMFQAIAHPDPQLPLTLKGSGVHHGLFIAKPQLPPAEAPGAGYPRHALFVQQTDVADHVRRLAEHGVRFAEPLRTAEFGEPGISLRWVDPDGNQREFWAPDVLPKGAMHDCGALRIGRISHGVYGSRDLARTAAFFERYCGLLPLQSPEIPSDTLVFALAAGGRLAFKHVAEISPRASGRGTFSDLHTALVVSEEDFWPRHERLWAELPEWEFDVAQMRFTGDGATLPARTLMHGSPNGRRFKAAFGRGDDWLDPDGNLFHFIGGAPREASMASYERFFIDDYMDAYLARRAREV